MARNAPQQEPLRLLELAAEIMGAHPVRLVDHDQVPLRFLKLGEQLLVARQLIHPRDKQRVLIKRRCAEHRLSELPRQNLKRQPKLQIQLVLPLIDQAPRRHDQTTLDVLAQNQLLDVEPAMIVLLAPGSSAKRKRRGRPSNNSPYTARS